jgi:hypothetical protein
MAVRASRQRGPRPQAEGGAILTDMAVFCGAAGRGLRLRVTPGATSSSWGVSRVVFRAGREETAMRARCGIGYACISAAMATQRSRAGRCPQLEVEEICGGAILWLDGPPDTSNTPDGSSVDRMWIGVWSTMADRVSEEREENRPLLRECGRAADAVEKQISCGGTRME